MATIAAILANANRKPDSEPFKLEDFIPHYKAEETTQGHQSWEDQLAIIQMINAVGGGKEM